MSVKTGRVEEIPLQDVKVDPERFRRTFQEVEALAESIKQNGLIHPIVVDENNVLIAGERRYRAHKMLSLPTIRATRLSDLSELEKRLIELEENLRREDLTWQEEVEAKAVLHSLYQKLKGKAVRNKKGGWTVMDTAKLLGDSKGKTIQDIQLGVALLKKKGKWEGEEEKKPSIIEKEVKRIEESGRDFSKMPTKSAAFKLLKTNEDLALRSILAKVESAPSQEDDLTSLKRGDALSLLKELSDESVDLVLTDPPWGVNLDGSNYDKFRSTGALTLADSHTTLDFLEPIMKELFRVLRPDTHIYVFFGFRHYERLREMMRGCGFKVCDIPLIWWKKNAFNAAAYDIPTPDYEPILFAKKGSRKFTHVTGSVFEFPPVPSALKRHQAEKPLPLLQHIIQLSTIEGELVLDPFAGSASTLMAAKGVKRRALGFEINEKNFITASDRLKGR